MKKRNMAMVASTIGLSVLAVAGCGTQSNTTTTVNTTSITNTTITGGDTVGNTTTNSTDYSVPTDSAKVSTKDTKQNNGSWTSTKINNSATRSNSTSPEKPSMIATPIHYTKQDFLNLSSLGRKFGINTVYIPKKGFHSKLTYAAKQMGPNKVLPINYTNIEIEESVKTSLNLQGSHTLLNTEKIEIPHIAQTPVVAQWWNNHLLSFKIKGVYVLIGGSKGMNEAAINEIAESLFTVP